MKRLVALAWLAGAGSALAQALPAPQFATPATGDSSSRAATTAWVRAQNLLTATSDLSQATVRPAGAPVARTQAARAADVFNVLDYGAVADGATDIGPALNAIAAKLGAGASSNVIYFPNGVYRLASAVTFAGTAPILLGQGFSQGPGAVGVGSWIKIDQTGFTPITFSGTNARGAKVRDLAFTQTHPAQTGGWAPTNYDYVFRVQDALGEVTFDNVLFAGVNRGIYADNSGRLNIRDVQGQFYTAGIEIDDCYDIPRIERLHAWTFATSNPNVVAYQEANADTVILRRVDGIFIGDLFALGMRSALYLTSGANGVTTKFYVNNLYADFVKYGLWVDGAGVNGQIANATTQHNDQTNSGATLPGGRGILATGASFGVEIGNWRTNTVAGPVIDLQSFNAHVDIANFWANTYGAPGAGTAAIFAADSGAAPANYVLVRGNPYLQGQAPLYLFNPGVNAGRTREPLMNMTGNDVNEPRAYAAVAGGTPSIAAVGGDANIDLNLSGKGTSGVRMQSNGQTVLRADNLNGSSNDFLLRGGAGTMNWVAEGGDANIDVYLSPKGPTGGVRLQAAGATVLRVDNPNASGDDLLVRGGAASMTLLPEGAEAAIDIYLAAKGGGGVRMQANGGTVLRVDNPGPGTSDLLVRSGAGTMALTVEDPGGSANLVLNPKGAGLVSTANCPPQSDNSANLACTSWVKSWVLAQGYGAGGGGGISALTGDVTASGTGSVAATLANAGAPGTYTRVTTDAKGRVSAGGQLAAADVTAALGFAPLPTASPQASGTLTVNGFNSLAIAGAASGAAPSISAGGGDASVDLSLSATGAAGSARLLANGGTVLRVDNPGAGNSDLLVRPGTATVGLTVESAAGSAGLSLNPKGAGTVTAPTPASSDNTTTVATTAFVKAQGYAASAGATLTGTATVAGSANSVTLTGSAAGVAPAIGASGSDANVDLALSSQGSGGSVRLRANGVTALRADSPGPGTSDLLVRAGAGAVSLTVEDAGANANLAINPKGSGVVTAPTPAASSNATTVATTGFVRSVLPCVAPVAGHAYAAPVSSPSTVGLTGSAGTQPVIALPMIVCGARQVTALAFEITTSTAAAFSARMALYADAGGLPSGAPLADSGAVAVAAGATGMQIAAISGGPTLAPGIYWTTLETSYLATAAVVKATNIGSGGGVGQALGYVLAAGATSQSGLALAVYVNQAFGAPPNPFGAPTGYLFANTPLVWVQF